MAMVAPEYNGNNLKPSYEVSGYAGYSDVDLMSDFDKKSASRFNSSENNNDSPDGLRNIIINSQNEMYVSYVDKFLAGLNNKK
jgi:hypothetical protein